MTADDALNDTRNVQASVRAARTAGLYTLVVLDRVPGSDRPVTDRPGELLPPALDRVRRQRGPFDSDDDLLIAVFYNPEQCRRLIDARPIPIDSPVASTPLGTLVKELAARRDIRSVMLVKR